MTLLPYDIGRVTGPVAIWGSYPKPSCGVSTYSKNLEGQLRTQGLEVVHINTDARDGRRNYHRIVARTGDAHPGCIIINYRPTMAGLGFPVLLRQLRKKLPNVRMLLIAHEQPSIYMEKLPRILRPAFRRYEYANVRQVDEVLVHTLSHLKEITDTYPAMGPKLRLFPFPTQGPRRSLEEALKKTREPLRRVLTFGTIRPGKGLETLIEAIQVLAREGTSLECRIAGGCDPRHKKYLRRLEQLAKQAPTARIDFLGFLEEATLDEEIREAHVVVLPYSKVTQSQALHLAVEYLVPIIASDRQTFKDMELHGILHTFSTTDAQGLAESLSACRSTGKRTRMATSQNTFLAKNSLRTLEIQV